MINERQIQKWMEIKLFVIWIVTLATLGLVIGISLSIGDILAALKQPCTQGVADGTN